jgi:peptidoglycan/xylan/chitin deacetylase (PgdA/CDA1 family)
VTLADDTSVGTMTRLLDIEPAAGRLLDVEGHVLDPQDDRGRILVDGRRVSPDASLSNGDAITVVDGVDRTEPTERIRTRLPGLRPGDPQYSLAMARQVRVDVVGRISGLVVSTDYRPVGDARRPRAVALTFDDGPWPGSTRAILRVLRRMNAKATFFVVGYLAKRRPATIRAELHAGMAIGSHSWSHPEPFDGLSPSRMEAEMRAVNGLLRRRFGVRVSVFRPPGGGAGAETVTMAARLGMRVVNWNVDPRDWSSAATPRAIAGAVLSNVERGSIVELHDGGGDRRATVRALPSIIRGIRRMGFKLAILR